MSQRVAWRELSEEGMTPEQYKASVVEHCQHSNYFVVGDDGFVYFWPTVDYPTGVGAWTSHDLRIIADELERRNKPWQEQIERELGPKV